MTKTGDNLSGCKSASAALSGDATHPRSSYDALRCSFVDGLLYQSCVARQPRTNLVKRSDPAPCGRCFCPTQASACTAA